MAVTVTRPTPPPDLTGFGVEASYGYEKAWSVSGGVYTDITAHLQGGGGAAVLVSTGDSLIIGKDSLPRDAGGNGIDCRWLDIHIAFSTPSTSDAGLVVEYLDGSGVWHTMSVVDGTAGLTQDGTIEFTRASFPSYTQWVGYQLSDTEYRGYIRITRTGGSAPTIADLGVGGLTANATYCYKAQHTNKLPPAGVDMYMRFSRSHPTVELSATTTNIKRSVKVYWDDFAPTQAKTDGVLVFRRPNGKDPNYRGVSQVTRYSELDTISQCVKGLYFAPTSGGTALPYTYHKWSRHTYVFDDGLAMQSRYNSSYTFYSYYMGGDYIDRSISYIEINADTEAEGNFQAIVDAAGPDWGIEEVQGTMENPETKYYFSHYRTGTHRIYRLWDNLVFHGYFGDEAFTLWAWGELNTQLCNSVRFGISGNGVTYDGCNIIFASGCNAGTRSWFTNAKLYDVIFRDDPWANSRTYRYQYVYSSIITNCKIIARSTWEKFSPMDSGVVIDGLEIFGLRYGMYFNNAASVPSVNHLHVLNGTSFFLNGSGFPGENTIEISNYRVNGDGANCLKWYAGSNAGHVEFKLMSPEFGDEVRHSNTDPYPANYYWYNTLGPDTLTITVNHLITLTVYGETGDPLPDATVTILDALGGSKTYTTNTEGKAQLELMVERHDAGTYYGYTNPKKYRFDQATVYTPFTLTIEADGYNTYQTPYTPEDSGILEVALSETVYPGTRYVRSWEVVAIDQPQTVVAQAARCSTVCTNRDVVAVGGSPCIVVAGRSPQAVIYKE